MIETAFEGLLALAAFFILAVLLSACVCGCRKDPPPPPEVRAPAETNLAKLQSVCWSIRMDWHHQQGWTVTAKWYKPAALGSSAVTADDADLDAALGKCLARIKESLQ